MVCDDRRPRIRFVRLGVVESASPLISRPLSLVQVPSLCAAGGGRFFELRSRQSRRSFRRLECQQTSGREQASKWALPPKWMDHLTKKYLMTEKQFDGLKWRMPTPTAQRVSKAPTLPISSLCQPESRSILPGIIVKPLAHFFSAPKKRYALGFDMHGFSCTWITSCSRRAIFDQERTKAA